MSHTDLFELLRFLEMTPVLEPLIGVLPVCAVIGVIIGVLPGFTRLARLSL